jgi:hypothetical protein
VYIYIYIYNDIINGYVYVEKKTSFLKLSMAYNIG